MIRPSALGLLQDGQRQGRQIVFVDGEETVREVERRSLQHPRVFYRREPETQPLVITRPDPSRP